MINPEVSVILPVYNGEAFLREAVNSVIKQTFQEWELIIVDDCSTDNTRRIISEYTGADDRIRVINNTKNMKLPGSLNVGFRQARGKYLTWTSDDNIYEYNALGKMRDYMISNPQIPMVVANMKYIDEQGNIVGEKEKYDRAYMAYANTVGACFLYSAEAAKRIGGYDESLFLVEDYDYWLRILFNCGEIGYIDECLYRYRMHDGSLTVKRKEQVKEGLFRLRTEYLSKLLGLAASDEDLILRIYCEMIEKGPLNFEQRMIFERNCTTLLSIVPIDHDKPKIIYGAGNYGKSTLKVLDSVAFMCDKNPHLIGKQIDGITIISVEQMLEMKNEYQIIVAVHHSKLYAVIQGLISIGVNSFSIIQSFLSGKIEYENFEKLSNPECT